MKWQAMISTCVLSVIVLASSKQNIDRARYAVAIVDVAEPSGFRVVTTSEPSSPYMSHAPFEIVNREMQNMHQQEVDL